MTDEQTPDWITPDGIDLGRLPLEPVVHRILDSDEHAFASTCTVLGVMAGCGRRDAGVFLLGLLAYFRDDLERLSAVVGALGKSPMRQTADALTAELHRVPSNNTTRRYLDTVLAALESLPEDLARERLVALSGDRSFSHKWRKKFQAALWDVDADEEPRYPDW